MPELSTNEFKAGVKLEIDAQPWVIVTNEFVKPGKGQAFNRVRLKNLLTGRVVEKTFKSGDKCSVADIEETTMRLLYQEGEDAVFMHDETFDQVHIALSKVGDAMKWLLDDFVYEVLFYKGEAVSIIPPIFMELKIIETAPGVRGDTASGRVMKPAKLESGAELMVPIFLEEGEVVKVDTRTGEYVSRVK